MPPIKKSTSAQNNESDESDGESLQATLMVGERQSTRAVVVKRDQSQLARSKTVAKKQKTESRPLWEKVIYCFRLDFCCPGRISFLCLNSISSISELIKKNTTFDSDSQLKRELHEEREDNKSLAALEEKGMIDCPVTEEARRLLFDSQHDNDPDPADADDGCAPRLCTHPHPADRRSIANNPGPACEQSFLLSPSSARRSLFTRPLHSPPLLPRHLFSTIP